MFLNRESAARLLAERLAGYRGQNPLVLGVPRGGVPMGRVIAQALDGELDVVLVRKLGAPGNSELAIGSVSETGTIAVNENARHLDLPKSYIEEEARRQMDLLGERRHRYTPGRPPADPRDRIVIVVDDGVATGATLLAALDLIREQGPRRLVAAAAVAPAQTAARLAGHADEVVCLETPVYFEAVSDYFASFRDLSDAEVLAILNEPRESGPDQAAERTG